MRQLHFSSKAFAGFIVFVVAFTILFSIDQGSGRISHAWPIFFLALIMVGSFTIYRRVWRLRGRPDEVRKAHTDGLYGVLPDRWRHWLFP